LQALASVAVLWLASLALSACASLPPGADTAGLPAFDRSYQPRPAVGNSTPTPTPTDDAVTAAPKAPPIVAESAWATTTTSPETTTRSADLALPPPPQERAPARGNDLRMPWELTLGASGSNNEDFDAGAAQLAASVGYYVAEGLELSIRQNLWFADAGERFSDTWNGMSRFAADYVFPSDWVRPFLGVNVGAVYGDTIKESLEAAPEAGVKFYVKDDAFIQVLVEYQFLFETSDRINDAFDNGQFVYGIDLGLRF